MKHAREAISQLVHQVDQLLEQIPQQDYGAPLAEFDGSSLGQHFRHILEFFQCLENGLNSGVIDYAARERNLLYEAHPAVAAQAFADFIVKLEQFESDPVLMVKAEFGSCDRPVYQSTLGRELLFVYDHAVHHLAIIKIGIRCSFPQWIIDRDLGVSPSTLKARMVAS
jgi:uncharacterized damage-inducible protein DinB